ncbi:MULTISPECIES: hypothetical protein [Bradyrhizobium]|uniref:Uncharacterized protein n=2 Tax=Bradyrhizobium TaxID=374 RepID=A0ABY0Q8D4_9BRAD|nr:MULTISPECIES: hypothetical protein [Bradyrhizobium]SDJ67550.1 hypothetical protein SAMN05444163_6124 [Bradyrhizobium ottawaense]SEC27308.1 hypothetical protein SAMN05444171_1035 [Bradyrhizobium lablabi]
MKDALEAERTQLLDQWRKRLRLNPDLEFLQARRIMAASNGDEHATSSLPDDLRKFHDKFGYKAKGNVSNGGLCAGAIFRTDTFIKTKQRSGSKKTQSVHIEHTFPIKELRAEIANRQFGDYLATITWLLKHSVTTAFHESEKEHLIGKTSNSGALNLASPEYLKPFARYEKLHSVAGIVWNVFDGERVDPEQFTFDDHLSVIVRILDTAGASKSMVSAIRSLA